MEDARQELRQALRDFGVIGVTLLDEEIDALIKAGYVNCHDLQVASHQSLEKAGLRLTKIDHILKAQGMLFGAFRSLPANHFQQIAGMCGPGQVVSYTITLHLCCRDGGCSGIGECQSRW
jgi:hypothetical protein